MQLLYRFGKVEIWLINGEFYVYGVTASGLSRVCYSYATAWELAAGAA
jgi:hypothetical protein